MSRIIGHLWLFRGVSGSGKSFTADLVADGLKARNQGVVVFSTDEFWVDEHGQYNFDAEALKEAHNWNENRVLEAMRQGVPNVIVPNTMTTEDHMMPYITMAEECGYEVHVLTCQRQLQSCIKDNQWGVPATVIQRQDERLTLPNLDVLVKFAHSGIRIATKASKNRLDKERTASAVAQAVEVLPAEEPEVIPAAEITQPVEQDAEPVAAIEAAAGA